MNPLPFSLQVMPKRWQKTEIHVGTKLGGYAPPISQSKKNAIAHKVKFIKPHES